MPQSYTSLYIHYVWTTKKRAPILTLPIIREIRQELFRIAAEKHFWVDCFNGVEDHVHALVSIKSTQTVAWVAQQMKGITSHTVNARQRIPGGLDWQDGYGAFSVSKKDIAIIRNYIRRQPEHHQIVGFEEEWKDMHEDSSLPDGFGVE